MYQCGRELSCGNHECGRDCHRVRGADTETAAGTNCRKCELECRVERPEGCSHPCSLPCHPAPCPPCPARVRVRCHCGLVPGLPRVCGELLAATEQERAALLCCGDQVPAQHSALLHLVLLQCPKLMPCGHRCSLTCHLGSCSSQRDCKKKVKVGTHNLLSLVLTQYSSGDLSLQADKDGVSL